MSKLAQIFKNDPSLLGETNDYIRGYCFVILQGEQPTDAEIESAIMQATL